MRYLYIEKEAINILVEDRFYQSCEFESALEILSFVRAEHIPQSNVKLKFVLGKECGYIYGATKVCHTNALIFDLTLFGGFSKRDEQAITILQKLLRFARKHWGNLTYSPNERKLEGNLAVVFPFPIMGGASYRVLLNLCPSDKIQDRKGVKYIAVTQDGCIDTLSDDLMSIPFKRIREEATQLCSPNLALIKDTSDNKVDALSVSVIDRNGKDIDAHAGYENWMRWLTKSQLEFVRREINGPERLEGAAGTGKTLTLILKAIYNIRKYIEDGRNCNMVFFTHSKASQKQIEDIFQTNYPNIRSLNDRMHSPVSIEITTLQEWCAKTLSGRISDSELLDIDAQGSKDMQIMLLEETVNECEEKEFPTYKHFCSSEFVNYMTSVQKETLLQMLQSEIAITIKGRANQDFEVYKSLSRLEGAIPVVADGDYSYLYLIYDKYQEKLAKYGAFDSDDIVLSAYSQLNTPLWRRRKKDEGYDIIFIDETHLFNYNELSIFHSLCKNDSALNLIFAIDKTQAVGDRGLNGSLNNELHVSQQQSTKYTTVFRSSPDIVNCAFHILTAGITLFNTFENPLDHVNYSFTAEDERKSTPPQYYLFENDDTIISESFRMADKYCEKYKFTHNKVLIVSTSNALLTALKKYADNNHKPYECLTQRADIDVVKSAESHNRYVIGHIDYVGGLEFDAVIIIGVDKDRVPPTNVGEDGYIFQSYAWHNRMYVAVSRAKYILTFMGDKSRGESAMLQEAIANGAIIVAH